MITNANATAKPGQSKHGVEEVKRVLRQMTTPEREKILVLMHQKYPTMAQKLKQEFFTIEDYLYFTPAAREIFWKTFAWEDMGYLLRGQKKEIADKILATIPVKVKGNVQNFLKTGRLISMTKIEEANSNMQEVFFHMWSKNPEYFPTGPKKSN